MALVAAHQEEYVTNNRLQQLLDTHAIRYYLQQYPRVKRIARGKYRKNKKPSL